MPGKKSNCPFSRDLMIEIAAKLKWCAKMKDIYEVVMPRGILKDDLWEQVPEHIEVKCPGAGWPEKVKNRGSTNLELLKYLYALNPRHRFFSKNYNAEVEDNSSNEWTDSEDSAFEAEFNEMLKDLIPKIHSKIPRSKKRVNREEEEEKVGV